MDAFESDEDCVDEELFEDESTFHSVLYYFYQTIVLVALVAVGFFIYLLRTRGPLKEQSIGKRGQSTTASNGDVHEHNADNGIVGTGPVSQVDNGIVGTGPLSQVDNGTVGTGPLFQVDNGTVGTGPLFQVDNGIVGTGPLFQVDNGIVGTGPLFQVDNGIVGTGPLSQVDNGTVGTGPVSQVDNGTGSQFESGVIALTRHMIIIGDGDPVDVEYREQARPPPSGSPRATTVGPFQQSIVNYPTAATGATAFDSYSNQEKYEARQRVTQAVHKQQIMELGAGGEFDLAIRNIRAASERLESNGI